MPGTAAAQRWPRLEEVVASPRLPTLPTVAVRIIDLVQQPDVSMDELAGLVSSDPALAAKFLQTANSSFYARRRQATRVRDAIMVLGLRAAKPLALGFSLVAQMRHQDAGDFDYNAFWTRSLFAAAISRAAASAKKTAEPDESFLGGLLHSLGTVALARVIGRPYDQLMARAGGSMAKQAELERERMGFDHTAVGSALADTWNLPPATATAMRCYLDPASAPPELQPLVRCVAAGAAGARVFAGGDAGLALLAFRTACEEWFGASHDDCERLLTAGQAEAVAMGGLLDLPNLDANGLGDILFSANEALERLTFAAIHEAQELERQNVDLSVEAQTDPLTGAATRRSLDAFLEAQIERAPRTGASISVLFVDLDHFKKLNDTYGHQAGDRTLQAVVRSIRDVIRTSDLVGRYGGEEFLVVCPGANLIGATALARRMRDAIASIAVDDGSGGTIRVTASIGVASRSAGQYLSAEEMVAVADRGLYAAKAAGRNTVRIGQDPAISAEDHIVPPAATLRAS